MKDLPLNILQKYKNTFEGKSILNNGFMYHLWPSKLKDLKLA